MTDRIIDGGPAFPTEPRGSVYGRSYDGMTLRDWFAGQALAAMLTSDLVGSADKGAVANQAYHYADAMLESRK